MEEQSKDQVKFQKFKQTSLVDWEYDIQTMNGKAYNARYQIRQYGFIEEVVDLNGVRMFQREFKPMDGANPSLMKIIENDGRLV